MYIKRWLTCTKSGSPPSQLLSPLVDDTKTRLFWICCPLQEDHVTAIGLLWWLPTLLRLGYAITQTSGPTCEGFFLIRSFEVGRFILSLAHLLVAAHWQGRGRRKLLLFACLPSLSLASSSTLLLPFAGVRIRFFGIPTYIEAQQLPGNSPVLLP